MNLIKKIGVFGIIAVSMAAISMPTFAQGQGGGRRRGGQAVTVAQLPVAVLDPALKLTDDQKTKINAIEQKLQDDTKALQPAAGAQPDPQARRDMMQKRRDLSQKANDDIQALLTDDQKTALTGLIKDVQAMGMAGIPPAALGELKLTDDQRTQIVKIGTDAQAAMQQKITDANGDRTQLGQIFTQARQDARTKTEAVLTQDQKDILKKYPQQQGFGGRGGRRRGGQGQAPPAQ